MMGRRRHGFHYIQSGRGQTAIDLAMIGEAGTTVGCCGASEGKDVNSKTATSDQLRLRIEPVLDVAQRLATRVRAELPTHDGLATAAEGVAAAARQAEQV